MSIGNDEQESLLPTSSLFRLRRSKSPSKVGRWIEKALERKKSYVRDSDIIVNLPSKIGDEKP